MRRGPRGATLSHTLFLTSEEGFQMGELLELVHEAFRRNDANDLDGFVAMQAADCEWVTPDGPLHGRQAVRQYVGRFRRAFPDGRHAIDRAVESGRTVAVEGRWSGRTADRSRRRRARCRRPAVRSAWRSRCSWRATRRPARRRASRSTWTSSGWRPSSGCCPLAAQAGTATARSGARSERRARLPGVEQVRGPARLERDQRARAPEHVGRELGLLAREAARRGRPPRRSRAPRRPRRARRRSPSRPSPEAEPPQARCA